MAVPELTYSIKHATPGQTPQSDPTKYTWVTETELPFSMSASYSYPYNTIQLTYTPDISLAYHEVRVTPVDDGTHTISDTSLYDWGIGKGVRLAYTQANIASNSSTTYNITLDNTKLLYGDGSYRIGLYAKSGDATGYWDMTYLFLTTESSGSNKIFAPSGYTELQVLTDEAIPSA